MKIEACHFIFEEGDFSRIVGFFYLFFASALPHVGRGDKDFTNSTLNAATLAQPLMRFRRGGACQNSPPPNPAHPPFSPLLPTTITR